MDVVDEAVERLVEAVRRTAWPAERVGHRQVMDVAGERAEAGLVGCGAGGERQRQVGAAVVAVIERDHAAAAGMPPGDLDRGLDRLGPGAEQGGALVEIARRQRVQRLRERDIFLVGCDGEADMGEILHLPGGDAGDLGHGMTQRHHRDSGGEIDELVAVDVPQDRAAGLLDIDRQHGGDRTRNRLVAARVHRHRAWTRNRRRQDASLFEGHGASGPTG